MPKPCLLFCFYWVSQVFPQPTYGSSLLGVSSSALLSEAEINQLTASSLWGSDFQGTILFSDTSDDNAITTVLIPSWRTALDLPIRDYPEASGASPSISKSAQLEETPGRAILVANTAPYIFASNQSLEPASTEWAASNLPLIPSRPWKPRQLMIFAGTPFDRDLFESAAVVPSIIDQENGYRFESE